MMGNKKTLQAWIKIIFHSVRDKLNSGLIDFENLCIFKIGLLFIFHFFENRETPFYLSFPLFQWKFNSLPKLIKFLNFCNYCDSKYTLRAWPINNLALSYWLDQIFFSRNSRLYKIVLPQLKKQNALNNVLDYGTPLFYK